MIENSDCTRLHMTGAMRPETNLHCFWTARRSAELLIAFLLAGIATADPESVPLKLSGGTYTVPVTINDKIELDFIVDSGAADVSIPADVFMTLIRTGTIEPGDMLRSKTYELADGTTRTERRFRIRSLRVGNLVLKDVAGSVAPEAAPALLLGQSFLSQLQTWSFDNARHELVLNATPQVMPTSPSAETNAPRSAAPATPTPVSPVSSAAVSAAQPNDDNDPDHACRAAQVFCREGSYLCSSYRQDFQRAGRECPGVTAGMPYADVGSDLNDDNDPDYACRAARNFCREGSYECGEYRRDFARVGRYCPGVTSGTR